MGGLIDSPDGEEVKGIDETTTATRGPRGAGLWTLRVGVLLAGTAALAGTFRFDYASVWFSVLSAALGLAWLAGWALDRRRAAGPRRAGAVRTVSEGVLAGVVLAAACAAGAVVLDAVPVIGPSIAGIVGPVDAEVRVTVLTAAVLVGAAEELMFRGAVFSWFPRRHRLWASTVLYAVVTLATGSIALVAAAILLGAVAGVLRERTGTLLAPVLCHVVWSVLLLTVLPWALARV